MKKISSFIKEERKNEKCILFWAPFILLISICLILLIVWRVSFIGCLLTLFLFFIGFTLRSKILLSALKMQIIIIFIFLVSFSIIFILTKENVNKVHKNDVINTALKDISFSNTYNFSQEYGTYKIDISTNKKDNRYEIDLWLLANTNIIPSDFIWDQTKASSYQREGVIIYELDQLEAFITSSNPSIKYYSHGSLSISIDYTNGAHIKEVLPTHFTIYLYSDKALKDFMNKYDKLEIYRYNIKEVGITDFEVKHMKDGSTQASYGYNAKRAYKLHPIITELIIPWNDIKTSIGL